MQLVWILDAGRAVSVGGPESCNDDGSGTHGNTEGRYDRRTRNRLHHTVLVAAFQAAGAEFARLFEFWPERPHLSLQPQVRR